MPPASAAPLHTFPDHAVCRLQAWPPHLRELARAVAPDVADGLAFEQATPLRSKLSLPDWRQIEPDLLFEVPYQAPGEATAMMVGVMAEHQSGGGECAGWEVTQQAGKYSKEKP